MLHGRLTRLSKTTAAVLFGLLASILVPTVAQAQSAQAADAADTVRLVQHADGSLEVQTGPRPRAMRGKVLVEEADVVLQTMQADFLGADGLANDRLRRDQWGLDLLEAEQVWLRADGSGQVIAVIDSGVDGRHPDLKDQLVEGFSATGGDELVDPHGHGTHVAGTAAAGVGQEYGIAGLAHGARIMPVQVTNAEGLARASDVAEGVLWAVDHGADVANLSLAGHQESAVLTQAINYAVDNGVTVVVAAGNEYNLDNPVTHPAAHPRVLAVGAMVDAERRSSFSSTGSFVDLAAPGSSILSDRPDAGFGFASGTSMAAPLVSAAVALLLSADDTLTPEGVTELVTGTARDIGQSGVDEEFGHGALDVMAALDVISPVQEPVVAPEQPQEPVVEDAEPAPAPGTGLDPITQTITDGSWLSVL